MRKETNSDNIITVPLHNSDALPSAADAAIGSLTPSLGDQVNLIPGEGEFMKQEG